MPAPIHYRVQCGPALVFGVCTQGDGCLGDEAAVQLRLAGHLPLPQRTDVVSVRLDTTAVPQYDFFQWGAGYRPYRLLSRSGAFEPVEVLVEVLPSPPAPVPAPRPNPYAEGLLRRAGQADRAELDGVARAAGQACWAKLCAALLFGECPGEAWRAELAGLTVALSSPAGGFPCDPWNFRLHITCGELPLYDAVIMDGAAL